MKCKDCKYCVDKYMDQLGTCLLQKENNKNKAVKAKDECECPEKRVLKEIDDREQL